MSALASAPRSARIFATLARSDALRAGYFGLLGLMTLPVLLFPVPRTIDLVNHWARLTMLRMPASDPLNAFYSVDWGAIPDLGIDLLYMALSPILDPQSVARLAFALSFWLPALGALALHGAFAGKKMSPTMLLTPLISYNVFTSSGFVNYGLGVGVALFALGYAARRAERPFTLGDFVALNLFAIAIFFCHILALAGYCLLFGLLRATPRPGEGLLPALRRGIASPAYVAAALALVALRPPLPTGVEYIGFKSWMLLAPVYNGLNSDLIFGGLLVAGLVGAMILAGARIAPPARLALAGFAAVALLAPPSYGATVLIDARLMAFCCYFALSACIAREPERSASIVAPAALMFALLRLAFIFPSWQAFDAEVVELREAFRAIPLGSRVLAVKPAKCADPARLFDDNLSTFAVIDRRSAANTLFAGSGMQPIRSRDEKLAMAPQKVMSALWLTEEGRRAIDESRDSTETTASPWADAFVHWRDHFDVVVNIHGDCAGELTIPGLALATRSALADVYMVK